MSGTPSENTPGGRRLLRAAAASAQAATKVYERVFGRPSAVPTVPVLPDRLTLGQHGVVADSGILAGGLVSLRAASVQGLSHRSGATTRQDSYSFAADEHRIVVAVADGLGSAPMSHLGAEAVARAAAAVALTGGIRDVAAAAFAALDALQDRHHRPAQDFATTLAVVVVDIGTAEGPWKVSAAEWGDSRASVHIPGSVVDGHPDWRRIAAATAGELYGNTVRPLPVFKEPTARGTADWSAGEMLLVASDGIDGQLAASNPVGHGLASAWESTPSLWQFIADVAFDRAGARDDRTAVCLFRPGPTTTETDPDGRGHPEGQAQPPESAPQTVVSDSGHSGKG